MSFRSILFGVGGGLTESRALPLASVTPRVIREAVSNN